MSVYVVGFQSLFSHDSTVPAPAGKNILRSSRSCTDSAQLACERVWYQNAFSSEPPRRMARSPASPETPAAKFDSSYFGNGRNSAVRKTSDFIRRHGIFPFASAFGIP